MASSMAMRPLVLKANLALSDVHNRYGPQTRKFFSGPLGLKRLANTTLRDAQLIGEPRLIFLIEC